MSPLLNHANLGEVQKTAYLTATITEVDIENDTASFTGIGNCPAGTDIPIFYHCEKDSEERDNGALEGAAGAFAKDDEVIVMCEIVSSSEYRALRVMGFVSKPKSCGLRIKLYRGDGVLITGWSWDGEESGDILTFLSLRNSDDDWIAQTVTYDAETEYWTLSVDNDEDKDSDGYWIVWQCRNGRLGNYPYRYFPVWDAVGAATNLRQPEDLQKVGSLVDIIPYFAYNEDADEQEPCHPGVAGYQTAAQRCMIVSSSVGYYMRFRLGRVDPGLTACSGEDWVLSCSEFSHTVSGELPDLSAFTSLQSINVQIPLEIATEIATGLSATESPDWNKFNDRFPSIDIGKSGMLPDTFCSDFTPGGDYDICILAFPAPIPYTLQF